MREIDRAGVRSSVADLATSAREFTLVSCRGLRYSTRSEMTVGIQIQSLGASGSAFDRGIRIRSARLRQAGARAGTLHRYLAGHRCAGAVPDGVDHNPGRVA